MSSVIKNGAITARERCLKLLSVLTSTSAETMLLSRTTELFISNAIRIREDATRTAKPWRDGFAMPR